MHPALGIKYLYNPRREKMKITDENILAAPCGLYCGECSDYKAGKCPGCRMVKGYCLNVEGLCDTFACADGRGVEFCYECDDFPCNRLSPAADMASIIPQNIKVFNLCFIQKQGLQAWIAQAPEIRKRYFQGKIVIGKGPL
jgi:hypothetical protein